MKIDFDRITNIIKKTKDKVILVSDDQALVVMDLDNYEKLISEKPSDFSKDSNIIDRAVKEVDFPNEHLDEQLEIKNNLSLKSIGKNQPISVKDLLINKANNSAFFNDNKSKANSDEYYFEEIDED